MSESGDGVLERKDQILAPLDPERYTTLMRLVTDPKHRVVASFGGGSVPGLCGNLAFGKILAELGIDTHVEEVWGTRATLRASERGIGRGESFELLLGGDGSDPYGIQIP